MEENQRREFSRAARLDDTRKAALFSELWREYYPRALVYFYSFTGLSAEDREELAADALFRVFEKSELYDPALSFEPWFFSLARNLALNRLKPNRSRPIFDPDSATVDRQADSRRLNPEDQYLMNEEEGFIASHLAALPERERELAFLVYGESLSLSEVAGITGQPLGTVKWRLSELRKGLKAAMGREYA